MHLVHISSYCNNFENMNKHYFYRQNIGNKK